MNALLYTEKTGLRLDQSYPVPEISDGEALIEVVKAGICNTDLEITRGYLAFAGVLGHEFVGQVVRVSRKEDDYWIGKRVVGDINAACGNCPTCKAGRPSHCPHRTTLGIVNHDGAFANYLRIPVANLYAVPESVPDNEAVFTEPLAAACEILQQYHLKPAERAAIIGDGKLGLLIAQVLRLTGAEICLIGRHPERSEFLTRRGMAFFSAPVSNEDLPVFRERIKEFDLVVECTGNQNGLEVAKGLVRPRGTIILKSTYHGQPALPLSLYVVDEVTLLGSRCGPFAPALRLLERGLIEVSPLISAEFKLSNALEAFNTAFGRGNIKVLISSD